VAGQSGTVDRDEEAMYGGARRRGGALERRARADQAVFLEFAERALPPELRSN
jgi:hypothetical protein